MRPQSAWSNPGLTHDGIGMDIRVDDVLLTTISMPNGTTQGTDDEYGNALTSTTPTATTRLDQRD